MGKKGGKKSKPMVVSKIKRANHLKQKKNRNPAAAAAAKKKSTYKVYQHVDKTQAKGKKSEGIPRVAIQKPVKKPAKAARFISDDIDADEMMEMMDDEDLAFLVDRNGDAGKKSRKRKQNRADDDAIEEEYDRQLGEQEEGQKRTRLLLPIKTAQGIIERSMEVEEWEDVPAETVTKPKEPKVEVQTPQSIAEVYAQRQKKLEELKETLGTTSSNIIENPDETLDSISTLLKLYDQLTPDIVITGSKLISVSLVELFKDLAPGFEIKQTAKPGEKLKKITRLVYGNEGKLLKYYQIFLKRLENMFARLKEGRKEKKTVNESKKRIGIFALKSMADLLVSMPHFNFAKNIVHALTPFTAHKDDQIRQMICAAFRRLFKEDKRGEISLHAVRQINHLVKNRRHHQIPPDCLDVLLSLRIKDVNLDREKEEEISRYKTLTRKQKLLILSKNERRRRKKIERLEKEIVAAKAEENKETKVRFQTETVKLVFTIYFRILKMAPKSQLMGTVLQGLAKFAHTINIDFFSDLVQVLNQLITTDHLDYRQCLHAVQVVLIMLSGQGEALNIDPLDFYRHLYQILFHLTAGPSNADVPIALDCLDNMLIKRKKKVSIHRVLAFTKRIATLSLQVQHNSGIALLSLIRILMTTHKQTDMLLDVEATSASGSFRPELEEPEHCNAASTVLWELHALLRHYHPTVAKFARHLLHKCPTSGNAQLAVELTRKNPIDFHSEYDPSTLAFKPAVQAPSNAPISWRKLGPDEYHDKDLEAEVSRIMNIDPIHVWNDDVIDKFYASRRS